MIRNSALCCLVLVLTVSQARGQASDLAPAASEGRAASADPAAAEQTKKLRVTVLSFKGFVAVRNNSDQPWQKPKKGMTLDQNAELRTGPRSWVHFHIQPNQRVTLDRLGVMKVLKAVYDQAAKKVKVDLGMRYGRTRYDVQAAGFEHEATVHTPGNMLSIRGTKSFVDNTPPFQPIAASYAGQIQTTTSSGDQLTVGDTDADGGDGAGDEVEDPTDADVPVSSDQEVGDAILNDASAAVGLAGDITPLVVADNTTGAAETSNPNTYNVSTLLGQDTSETNRDNSNPGGGFSVTDTPQAPPPQAPPPLPPPPPPPPTLLEFKFTWQAPPDLDGFVMDPLGNTVCVFEATKPGCVLSTQQGAVAGPDHFGGTGANEHIRWEGDLIPTGTYTYGMRYINGTDPATFQSEVLFRPEGGTLQAIGTLTDTLDPTKLEATKNVAFPPSQ